MRESLEVSECLDSEELDAASVAERLLVDGEHPLRLTQSICPACVDDGLYEEMKLPALILRRGEEVWMRKECPRHGPLEDVYWSDVEMYERVSRYTDKGIKLLNPEIEGDIDCPSTCGLCSEHESHTGLANVVVTNRCDLSCFYCFFYAREGEPVYEPTLEEIREALRNLKSVEPVGANCLQITGGEPAVRDDVVKVVEAAREEGFEHVQFNTNGIEFSRDAGLVSDLKEVGVNVVYLSFDGLTPSTNVKNYHEFPDALENLRRVGLGTVLVPTVIGGRNDSELGDIVRLAAGNMDVVRGVNFQPVSLVGRMPRGKRMEKRITIPDVCELLEEQTGGQLAKEDFYPVPIVTKITDFIEALQEVEGGYSTKYRLSIHPTCGVGTYVFRDEDDELVPINQFIEVDGFFECLDRLTEEIRSCRFKRFRKTASLAKLLIKLRSLVDEERQPSGVDIIGAIYKALSRGDYDGLRDFHNQGLFIGMMHFMDPYNYDVDRIHKCDIHYAAPNGRIIPFCAYNVLPELYRDEIQAERSISAEEWEARKGRSLADDKYDRSHGEEGARRAGEFYAGYREKPYRR
ncbi:MAG: 7,8-dihydro-6-hydroxymethylpterin dimethyltransferase [Methanonatronarchaeales archaeon]|nr:7,8-dihydro-6-hydroxymethylpterin dimethyltransferase [Methanonatronarchaeales archaeon]